MRGREGIGWGRDKQMEGDLWGGGRIESKEGWKASREAKEDK